MRFVNPEVQKLVDRLTREMKEIDENFHAHNDPYISGREDGIGFTISIIKEMFETEMSGTDITEFLLMKMEKGRNYTKDQMWDLLKQMIEERS